MNDLSVAAVWGNSLDEADADALAATMAGLGGLYGALFLTPTGDGEAVVGIEVEATKLSVRLPAELLVQLALRALEVGAAADGGRTGDLAAIREMLLTEADWHALRERAASEAAIQLEQHRAIAVELGRREGCAEWAEGIIALAETHQLRKVEAYVELQRLAPLVAKARAALKDGRE
jgi:hypothetical protein